jgi:hypothetical protein
MEGTSVRDRSELYFANLEIGGGLIDFEEEHCVGFVLMIDGGSAGDGQFIFSRSTNMHQVGRLFHLNSRKQAPAGSGQPISTTTQRNRGSSFCKFPAFEFNPA